MSTAEQVPRTYPESPVMPETPVSTDLLQTLKILTELVVQDIGHDLDKNELTRFKEVQF